MALTYSVHGLNVRLPFACAELGEQIDDAPDVEVIEGEVPRSLDAPLAQDEIFHVTAHQYLQRGDSSNFLVEHGCRITFHKNPGCEEAIFTHQLLYPVMAALLRQRGLLVLHASAAIGPAGAVLVTGVSGAGKSTTIAGLTARGWAMQSDDVSALRTGPGGALEVLPGTRHVHVNQEAADRLAVDTSGLVAHAWHRMKLGIPRAGGEFRQAAPVAKIVYLRHSDAGLAIEPVRGWAKVPLLMEGIYGPFLPEQHARAHSLLAATLRDIPMLSIARPADGWSLDAVLEAIERG